MNSFWFVSEFSDEDYCRQDVTGVLPFVSRAVEESLTYVKVY